MKMLALLRGVMPTGKNRIPKMSYLVEILEDIGFTNVKTYIQSGNVILDSHLSKKETAKFIHDIILEKIGADLVVFIRDLSELEKIVQENPFNSMPDLSNITFTDDPLNQEIMQSLESIDFGVDALKFGNSCAYLSLTLNNPKRKLYTAYLEKNLKIVATTRKLTVINRLISMMKS